MLKAPIHRWGDLRKCDTPLRTIEAMYKHIAAHHTIDLIYWTGDLPPHDIWNQSRDGNVEVREKSRASHNMPLGTVFFLISRDDVK